MIGSKRSSRQGRWSLNTPRRHERERVQEASVCAKQRVGWGMTFSVNGEDCARKRSGDEPPKYPGRSLFFILLTTSPAVTCSDFP